MWKNEGFRPKKLKTALRPSTSVFILTADLFFCAPKVTQNSSLTDSIFGTSNLQYTFHVRNKIQKLHSSLRLWETRCTNNCGTDNRFPVQFNIWGLGLQFKKLGSQFLKMVNKVKASCRRSLLIRSEKRVKLNISINLQSDFS